MSRSELPKAEKGKVKEHIQNLIGPTIHSNPRRKDWIVTRDDKLSVFITFSKFYEYPQVWWYDIASDDLDLWSAFSRSFVVFVMDNNSHVLIIPVPRLQELFENLETKGHNEYKLHISRLGGYKFTEIPWFDLTPFYNNYSQLTD